MATGAVVPEFPREAVEAGAGRTSGLGTARRSSEKQQIDSQPGSWLTGLVLRPPGQTSAGWGRTVELSPPDCHFCTSSAECVPHPSFLTCGKNTGEREVPSSLPPSPRRNVLALVKAVLCVSVRASSALPESTIIFGQHVFAGFFNLNYNGVTHGVTDCSFVLAVLLYQAYILWVHTLLLKYLRFTVKLQL